MRCCSCLRAGWHSRAECACAAWRAAVDAYKKLLGRRNATTGRLETSGLATTLAGAAAGVTSTITCFPLEVLRTRLACSDAYNNVVHAAVSIVRTEGPRALYGGLGPSLAGVIPYAGANLGMYDGLRWAYCRSTGEERVPKVVALLIGSLAGVSAATATFPLEVVRRRMMMGCVTWRDMACVLPACCVLSRVFSRACADACGISTLALQGQV